MNVLVACEESQRVCIAFREKGHNAYSCDILPCSGGHPEWHIQGDVLEILNRNGGTEEFPIINFFNQLNILCAVDKWDLIIAHPPCIYLTAAGACRMYPKKGEIDVERLEKAYEAKKFFMALYNADCEKICVENPRPLRVVELPKETQQIQPYEHGEPYSKLTYLWLKGLEPLKPTNILTEYKPFVSCGTSRNKGNPDKAGYSRAGGASKARSKTFWGIARAMAEQWG